MGQCFHLILFISQSTCTTYGQKHGPKGKPLCSKERCKDGVRYNRSKSGWIDHITFLDWFNTCFLPHALQLEGKIILLGDNLSTHFCDEMIHTKVLRAWNFIHMFCSKFNPPVTAVGCYSILFVERNIEENIEENIKGVQRSKPSHKRPTQDEISGTSKTNIRFHWYHKNFRKREKELIIWEYQKWLVRLWNCSLWQKSSFKKVARIFWSKRRWTRNHYYIIFKGKSISTSFC